MVSKNFSLETFIPFRDNGGRSVGLQCRFFSRGGVRLVEIKFQLSGATAAAGGGPRLAEPGVDSDDVARRGSVQSTSALRPAAHRFSRPLSCPLECCSQRRERMSTDSPTPVSFTRGKAKPTVFQFISSTYRPRAATLSSVASSSSPTRTRSMPIFRGRTHRYIHTSEIPAKLILRSQSYFNSNIEPPSRSLCTAGS